MSRNLWTEIEDNLLIEARLQNLTYKEIQENILPHRTFNSVRVRGSLLINRGLYVSNTCRSNASWTTEEEEALLKLKLNKTPYKEISTILGRTESSIKNKINVLITYDKTKDTEKDKLLEIVKKYPSKQKYRNRYYYKCDIPHPDKIREIFGGWDEVLNLIDNTKTILYYIKINKNNKFYYKIGITKRTIKERFKSENITYEVIKEQVFNTSNEARNLERTVLDKFKSYITKDNVLSRGGNTEIFDIDILA